MAGAPQFKVYNPSGDYVAACKHGEDAAAIVAGYGDGATIRDGHSKRDIVWTEGAESFPAGESYDGVALLIAERIEAKWAAARARHVQRFGDKA
jgi:hypothetical protein